MARAPAQISVLMAIYNGADFLKTAIESILNQTFTDWTFVIVDDASTDQTKEILSSYASKEPRIHIIKNETNLGLTKSLNVGLREIKSPYIARFDADDISLPNRLQKQYDFMQSNPDIAFCGSNAIIVDAEEKLKFVTSLPETSAELSAISIIQNPFIHPSTMLRKSVLDTFNIDYDESFKTTQDWVLWVEIMSHGKTANIKEPLIKQRYHPSSISHAKRDIQITNSLRVQKRYLERFDQTDKWDETFFKKFNAYFMNDRQSMIDAGMIRPKFMLEVLHKLHEILKEIPSSGRKIVTRQLVFRSILLGLVPPIERHWLKLLMILLLRYPAAFLIGVAKILSGKR
ncbi:glycosyltransferase [Curvivirga aplysinae]|uniref:glycosyltransferase n=1 Tax=Curvivirga aplysinae TaxID=2529852 RepID=UPI001C3F4E94|nr:glycosyltransferase [Curvivirga aplysinae]